MSGRAATQSEAANPARSGRKQRYVDSPVDVTLPDHIFHTTLEKRDGVGPSACLRGFSKVGGISLKTTYAIVPDPFLLFTCLYTS